MLGLRLVLTEALSRAGQAGLELRLQQDGARQAAASAAEEEELLLRRLSSSSSLDAGKLGRIAERLCGLRGLDGGVESEADRERGAEGQRGGAGEREGESGGAERLFSGASAVRWLVRSGLASGRLSGAAVCRALLSSSLILNARGGRRGFFCSRRLLYRFPAALDWDDGVTAADIARLALDAQPHLEIIAALCQHHNARELRRQQADDQQQPSSSPSRRSSVHRSRVLPTGQFLGCELVRWLRRRSLIACTKDGLTWGNYLLQQRWIAAETEGAEEEQARGAGATAGAETGQQPQRSAAGFRYAAVRYCVLPTAAAKAAAQQQQQQQKASRQAEAAAVASCGSLAPAAAAESAAPAAALLGAEALLTVAELQREPGWSGGQASASLVSSSWSPAAGECVCCPPSSPSVGSWEFVQSFGDEAAAAGGDADEGAEAEDLVTAVQFSPCGGYLAIGDKAGRVSVVEQQAGGGLEYRFYTEFQSHEPGFDSLKSCEVSARIGCIEWWPFSTACLRLLTANDKTVKLWRLDSRETHAGKQKSRADRPRPPALGAQAAARPALSSHSRSRSASTVDGDSASEGGDGRGAAECDSEEGEGSGPLPSVSCSAVRAFSDLHAFSIHSVSASADGCSFVSADDLRVLLFDVEHAEAAVCVMDVAAAASASASASGPAAPETGVDELLTVARFHPTDAALLCVGSSNGCVRVADLRIRHSWEAEAAQQLSAAASPALDDATAAWWSASAADAAASVCSIPSAFRAITDSVLDARWCGPHCLLVRDYLHLRCWDRRRLSSPLHVSCVHPWLLPLLPQLLQSEALFDGFQCAASPSGTEMVTGSYSNCFAEGDTRVLTDCGLLFLDQIEALQRAGREPLFGCYDSQSKALLYRKGRLVLPERPPSHLLEFTSAGEGERWAEGSGDYGWEGAAEDGAPSLHVSLRVTPEHEMLVQLGSRDVSGAVSWSCTGAVPQPHSKVKAEQLLSAEPGACLRMLACAEAGYAPQSTSQFRAVQRDLHLDEAQFDAFLELLGFWLGDGSLGCSSAGTGYVSFGQARQGHLSWLRSACRRAGLKEDEDWLPSSSGCLTTPCILQPAWFAFFDREFGGQSRRSHCCSPSDAVRSACHSSDASHGMLLCDGSGTGCPPCLRGLHLRCLGREHVPDGNCCRPAEDGRAVGVDEDEDEEVPVTPELPVDDEPSAAEDQRPPPSSSRPGCVLSWRPAVKPAAIQPVQHLPDWAVRELSAAQMRRLISGLHRAAAAPAGASNAVSTSCARLRDQLMQALLHCGYSACCGLMQPKGSVRGYRLHGQSKEQHTCSISFFAGLSAEEQRDYRPILAASAAWKVSWAELDGGHRIAAAGSCWPSMSRQQCIRRVPYDAGRDGRSWCVEVAHADHLILAQRAHRGLDGAVTVQSRPVVVGNCFTLHSAVTQRTVAVQAADDVREMRAVAAFRNPQLRDLLASLPSPPAALPASVARCWMPAVEAASASPSCPLQLQQKVLKVAWHPHLQAVAVASLYKLYLYQHHSGQLDSLID